jgi:NitT/TauT family transport system substrate-binding protein
MVLSSYIKAKPQVVQGFVNAIQRGLNWANSHSAEEVSKLIHKFPGFADIEDDQFLASIRRMFPQGVPKTPVITKEAFETAMKLPLAIGAIDAPLPYEQLVVTRFAEEAARKYPPAGK